MGCMSRITERQFKMDLKGEGVKLPLYQIDEGKDPGKARSFVTILGVD